MTNKIKIDADSLTAASNWTENYTTPGAYDEIFYDRSTGEIWCKYHVSLGRNEWTVYHDPNVIKIGETAEHLTQRELRTLVRAALAEK